MPQIFRDLWHVNGFQTLVETVYRFSKTYNKKCDGFKLYLWTNDTFTSPFEFYWFHIIKALLQ